MSALAVIVLVIVAVLLLAMLLAGARKAAGARARGSHPDRFEGHRSHAEASRRGDAEQL